MGACHSVPTHCRGLGVDSGARDKQDHLSGIVRHGRFSSFSLYEGQSDCTAFK